MHIYYQIYVFVGEELLLIAFAQFFNSRLDDLFSIAGLVCGCLLLVWLLICTTQYVLLCF